MSRLCWVWLGSRLWLLILGGLITLGIPELEQTASLPEPPWSFMQVSLEAQLAGAWAFWQFWALARLQLQGPELERACAYFALLPGTVWLTRSPWDGVVLGCVLALQRRLGPALGLQLALAGLAVLGTGSTRALVHTFPICLWAARRPEMQRPLWMVLVMLAAVQAS